MKALAEFARGLHYSSSMKNVRWRTLRFAFCMSALAGCVDAIGFLQLGGYFVAFMSGNTTRLAIALTHTDGPHVLILGCILSLFVGGAVIGTLLSQRVGPQWQMRSVLLLVTVLLTLAAVLSSTSHATLAVACMALAMGAENIALQRDGDIIISLTYMTGTLVKLGQRIALALSGGDRWAWLPFLLLWLSLLAGGMIGALLFYAIRLQSLWAASGAAMLLTLAAYRMSARAPEAI